MTARLPSFANALKAVWLLTWKSQWELSRLPVRIGSLLVLPALVIITVISSDKWLHRMSFFGDPEMRLNSVSRMLEKQKMPMDDAQKAKLLQILTEEYGQAQSGWSEVAGETADSRRQRLQGYLEICGHRIRQRAAETLRDSQMTYFDSWEEKTRAGIRDRLIGTRDRLMSAQAPWGRTTPFYHWLIDFYFFIILPLTCVRACGALIRDELQADTLSFLVTRPVSRARILIVKYISQVLWLEIVLMAETLLLFAAGAGRQIPDLGALLPLFIGAQLLAVPAWSALGALLGQITSRYMAAALIYGAVVEMGIGRIPTNINSLSLLRHIEALLSRNGQLQGVFNWDPGSAWGAIAALVAAPFIFCGAAAVLFSIMEYHASAEMQK